MSEKALPLIFLNLSGEMLYVLDQRLYAQKIQEEKGKKSKLHFFLKTLFIISLTPVQLSNARYRHAYV
jgi:hypothetical protein